jgi:hypothetical protein
MTAIRLGPESELSCLVFGEVGIREERLEKLGGDKVDQRTYKQLGFRQLTFHTPSAASKDDLTVASPYEKPTPMG